MQRYCGTLPQREGRGCWLRQRGKRYKGDIKECVEPEEGRTEEEERNVKQKYNGREKKDILREKQKLSSEQRKVSKNQFTGLHKFMCHKSVTNC